MEKIKEKVLGALVIIGGLQLIATGMVLVNQFKDYNINKQNNIIEVKQQLQDLMNGRKIEDDTIKVIIEGEENDFDIEALEWQLLNY